jgi:NtrC-family two-component system sensor histidine kinase KinB
VYYTDPHHFTGDEMELLTILASQAAIALENARLYSMTDQALAQRVEELSAVLNSVHEGILMLDMQNRIVIANPAVERLLEIPSYQLIGHTLPEVVSHYSLREDQRCNLQRAWQLPATLERDGKEMEGLSKDIVEIIHPRLRILERVFAPVTDKTGTPLGRVVVLRDITEEKALERMREDLSDMIVHDLRTPLASIISGSTLLEQMIHEQNSEEEVTPLMRIITSSGQRMLDLVNSLLDISRMEAGKLALDAEPFDLLVTAERVVFRLRSLIKNYQVEVEVAIPPDFPAVWGDQDKITRVLINLLDNAIKFTPEGGKVRISAQMDQRGTETDGGWAVCSVLDTGPGIPAEHRDFIFDKFTQLPSTHSEKEPDHRIRGSGIGLNFCKLTVEAHGGRIWVEAGPDNQGSLFKFTLPLADELESSAPAERGIA